MNNTEKKNAILEFAQELKIKGFKVYAPKDITSYAFFVKDNKIGYVERGDFGWNFSTVHKPCRECGTGYSMHREESRPTIEMAEDSLALAPNWASNRDIQAINKYKDWADYANYPINRYAQYEEI